MAKRVLAHSNRVAMNRRASFEERARHFQDRHLSPDEIRQEVNSSLDIRLLSDYFGKAFNPVLGFSDGKSHFSERGLRDALTKKGADLSLFRMALSPEVERVLDISQLPWFSALREYLGIYNRRDDVITQTCTLTYNLIQMEIVRWRVQGSPYGLYVMVPTKQMPCNPEEWVLRDDEFYLLDLPSLLMDLSREFDLREEEITYNSKLQRIETMSCTVLDEDSIEIDPANPADSIRQYCVLMTDKYKDPLHICNLRIPPDPNHRMVQVYDPQGPSYLTTAPQEIFNNLCKEKDVEATFDIPEPEHLERPTKGYLTNALFTVGDYKVAIEERYHSIEKHNKLTISPNAEDLSIKLVIKGTIGYHALVGFLKLLPDIRRQIDCLSQA